MTGTPETGSAREVTTEPTSYGPDAARLRSIFADTRTIAVVGLSSRPERPSYGVSAYMQGHGYRIVPVNPKETEVLGETAYPSLPDVPKDIRIDIVDVFRRAELTPPIARDAVRVGAKVLWLQEGIVNDDARRIAEDAGLMVIMGVCIRVAHGAIHERERADRMQSWEYFVAPLLEHNPGEILNTFGEDGWELVTVLQLVNPMGGQSLVAYLKRPKA